MTSLYFLSLPLVNRELRQSCRFSTIAIKAYTISTLLSKLLVLIMDLCIKALDTHLCSLGLNVPTKYAYLKLCTTYPLFHEFYIFKPELSDEWGVDPKSVERYFSRFEKYKLFARNHKKSKDIGKSGPALYGKLTPPASVLLKPLGTFYAKFCEIETSTKGYKLVLIKDVFGEREGMPIHMNYCWLDYTEEMDKLRDRGSIKFLANSTSYKTENGKERWLLDNVKLWSSNE